VSSYRRAIEGHWLLQAPLFTEADFIKGAKERGLHDLERDALEGFDREDLLPPVGYVVGSALYHQGEAALLASGDLRLREEHGFRDWSELAAEDPAYEDRGGRGRLTVLYGPWQLMAIWELHYLVVRAPGRVFHRRGLAAFREALVERSVLADDARQLADVAAPARRRELVLLPAQDLILPRIRNYWRGGHHPDLGDSLQWLRDRERAFDWAAAAADCDIDADGLEQMYRHLAGRGRWLDPLREWFLLADHVDRRRREKLRGDALVALDFYDAARVLRGWHSELTGEQLPDVDELELSDASQRKRRRYGVSVVRNNREALPLLLDEYDLYPWRMQLIVGGPSDAALLRTLFEESYGSTFERVGIRVFNVGGDGQSAKLTERYLSAVRAYPNYNLLVFDDEANARTLAERLRAAGVIEEIESHIWKEDLEADNFSFDEICDVIDAHVRTRRGDSTWRLDRAELLRREADEHGKPQPAKLLELARRVSRGAFRKPELAVDLGQLAARQRDHPEGGLRPVVDLIDSFWQYVAAGRRNPADGTDGDAAAPGSPDQVA
jgi:hypothetical protein